MEMAGRGRVPELQPARGCAMDGLLAEANARLLHGVRPGAATAAGGTEPHVGAARRPTEPHPVDEQQAKALWAWVQGKDAARRWDRPWTRERVAESHVDRRRNAGLSGGISGTTRVADSAPRLSFLDTGHATELVRRRPATAGVRRPPPPPEPSLAAGALEPVRPLARSRRRRHPAVAQLAGADDALPALGTWSNPTVGSPLAARPQSAGPAAAGVAVSCMHPKSGWMWGRFEGRYGKQAKRAVRIIQRRWRTTKRGRVIRVEFVALQAASLEIQRRARGWLARQEAARRRRHRWLVWASVRIQVAWRGFCGRMVAARARADQAARERVAAEAAAMGIQRVWRGRYSRRELAPWLEEARANRDRLTAEELATAARIEAMRRTRRMAEARRQRLEQARLRRKHTPTMRDATSFMKQSVARRQFSQWQARQERRKAAVASGEGAGAADATSTKAVYQSVIRSELELRAAKAERWRRGKAATVIQRWWREVWRCLQASRECAAAVLLQCGWRSFQARRHAAELRRLRAAREAAARAALAAQLRKLAEAEAEALQKILDSGLAKREGVPHVEPYQSSQHEAEVAATVESMLQTLQITLEPWLTNGHADADAAAAPAGVASTDARTAQEQAEFAAESERVLTAASKRRQDERDRMDLLEAEHLMETGRVLLTESNWAAAINSFRDAEMLVPRRQILVAERASALLEEAQVGLDMELRRTAHAAAKALVEAAIEAAVTPSAPAEDAEEVRPRLRERVVETSIEWVGAVDGLGDSTLPPPPPHSTTEQSSAAVPLAGPSFNDCYDVWVKTNMQGRHLSEAAMRQRVHLSADPPSFLDLKQWFSVSTFIDSTSLPVESFGSDSLIFCDGGVVADGTAWRAALSNGDSLLQKIAAGISGPFFAVPKETEEGLSDDRVA